MNPTHAQWRFFSMTCSNDSRKVSTSTVLWICDVFYAHAKIPHAPVRFRYTSNRVIDRHAQIFSNFALRPDDAVPASISPMRSATMRKWIAALSLGVLSSACETTQNTPDDPIDENTLVRTAAYFLDPHSGGLKISADTHTSIDLRIQNHRPGRSDLWIDGRNVGHENPDFELDRAQLRIPVAGAMIAGRHRLQLFSPEFPRAPWSPPIVIEVLPANTRALELLRDPDFAEIPALHWLHPGQMSLQSAALATISYAKTEKREVLHIWRNEASIRFDAPDLELTRTDDAKIWSHARQLALTIDEASATLWSIDDSSPEQLLAWQWSLTAPDSPTSVALHLPRSHATAQSFTDLAIHEGQLWTAFTHRRLYSQSRPGEENLVAWTGTDWNAWFDPSVDPSVNPSLDIAAKLNASATTSAADFRLLGTRTSTTQPQRRELLLARLGIVPERMAFDPQFPLTNPTAAQRDSAATLRSLCSTVGPFRDEIWAGLDSQGKPVAGTTHLGLGRTELAELPPDPVDDEVRAASTRERQRFQPQCGVFKGQWFALIPDASVHGLTSLIFNGETWTLQRHPQRCAGLWIAPTATAPGASEPGSRVYCWNDDRVIRYTLQSGATKTVADPQGKRAAFAD